MKCGLFAALSVALLIVLFGGSSASAQYWSGIQLADSFGYGATDINGELTCEFTDLSTSLGTVLGDNSKWESTNAIRDQARQNYSDALNLGHGWALVKDVSPYAGGIRERAYIIINTTSYPVFNTTGIVLPGVSGQNTYILIENKTHLGSCDTRIIGSFSTSASQYLATPDGVKRPFISTIKINYPANYDGPIIPETYTPPVIVEPEVLKPEYQYSMTKSGKFSIKYLDNLPHFLTGSSTIVIESMTENWESIDESIDTIGVTPAGWLDETYQLPAQGYYNIRIDHNQQLDSPPWDEDDDDKYEIGQVWIQLHYDGKTVINATTADCGGICNTQRPDVSDSSPVSGFFKGLDNLNTFGLTQFFTAPINFLATLPDKADNCSPISFPLLGQSVSIECLKPRYYDWSAAVMNIYTTLMIAGTGYLIAFNVFRHVKDINTPDKDKIEVARL